MPNHAPAWRWRRLAFAALLVATGAATGLATRTNLYASAVLCGLLSLWLALLCARADPPPPERPAPSHAPDQAVAGRRLRLMLDHAPVPLALRAPDGGWHAVNRAARRLFATDDRIGADAALLQAALAGAPGDRRLLRLGGAGVPRGFALSASRWSTGETLVALVDIQAEIQAAEATALRDLLQTLSHEIMNSLTPVMSLAESAAAMLAEEAGIAEVARDALQTIARRAAGLDRFVQGYRALARVPAPTRRTTSVGRLLEDIFRLFETTPRAGTVTMSLSPPTPDVMAVIDPDLISQALLALLANGAEAALAHPGQDPRVYLDAGAEADAVWFCVRDTGLGVPAERREAIFAPMVTFKPGGTGIGLAIARQIALSHGGDLTLAPPIPGQGASFRLVVR